MERNHTRAGDGHRPWVHVNVVSVTYNNEDTVEDLLDNLREQGASISEVVLHDNGSTDSTLSKIQLWLETNPGLNVTTVRSTNVGFGAGVAGGCAAFVDQTLPTLCINPDAVLSSGTLDKMLSVMNSDMSIGVVTAPLVRANGQLDTASVRTLPRFGSSLAYSIVGQLLPKRFRYNAFNLGDLAADPDKEYTTIQATTGALMLVNPTFRTGNSPIFDHDYWMYGEDLQLCKDAASEGFKVVMINWRPSLHLKGISSGWPRGRVSDRAFHDALFLYYSKNMSRGPFDRWAAKLAVEIKFTLSRSLAAVVRLQKNLRPNE